MGTGCGGSWTRNVVQKASPYRGPHLPNAMLLLAALIFQGSLAPRAQKKPQQENPSNAPVADGTSVVGVTVREDGSPVAGAQVSLLVSRRTYYGALNPRKVTAGADGKFVFDAVAEGDYRIWAAAGSSLAPLATSALGASY